MKSSIWPCIPKGHVQLNENCNAVYGMVANTWFCLLCECLNVFCEQVTLTEGMPVRMTELSNFRAVSLHKYFIPVYIGPFITRISVSLCQILLLKA